jgi:hypothetical protein
MGGTIYCNSFSDQWTCQDHSSDMSCYWNGYSCVGGSMYIDCDNYRYDPAACEDMMFAGCYWSCTGSPYTCNTYTTSSGCSSQTGCTWRSIQRTITNSSRGVNIPNLNVNYLCEFTGTNCVTPRAINTATPYVNRGLDNSRRELRRESYVSCPANSYLSQVKVVGDSVEAHLEGSCRQLPIY